MNLALTTILCFGLVLTIAPANADSQSEASGADSRSELPADSTIVVHLPGYLQIIKESEGIFMTQGYSAAPSHLAQCIETARSKGASISKELHDVYNNGTPAGRFLAADLISEFDVVEGKKLLRALANDNTEVKTLRGCFVVRQPLSHFAKGSLERIALKFPPPHRQ